MTRQDTYHQRAGAANRRAAACHSPQVLPDHFVTRNGVTFAGTHLIADLWGAQRLDDRDLIEATLHRMVDAAGATLLHIHLHRFTPHGGISGVAVLAESHISVHTWPERDYGAFDIFMCGGAKPHAALDELRRAYQPARVTITEHRRGVIT